MISKELNKLQLVLFKSPVVAMVMYTYFIGVVCFRNGEFLSHERLQTCRKKFVVSGAYTPMETTAAVFGRHWLYGKVLLYYTKLLCKTFFGPSNCC